MQKVMQKTVVLLVSGLFLAGCHSLGHKKRCGCKKKDLSAVAEIKSVSKTSAKGRVQFDYAGRGKVQVTADIEGLKPNAQLGFHLHEFGDCGAKGLSAGGHFNPKGHKHGGPSHKERHLGDLGNLKTDARGRAVYSKVVPGKLYKFLGRSVVIHNKADDLKTQPSGASGARVACGVVGAVRKISSAPAGEKDSTAAPKNPVQTVVKKGAKNPAKTAVGGKAVKTKVVPAVAKKSAASPPPVKKASQKKASAVPVKPAVSVSKSPKKAKAVQKTSSSAPKAKKAGKSSSGSAPPVKKAVRVKKTTDTADDNSGNAGKAKAAKKTTPGATPSAGATPASGGGKAK